MRSFLIQKVNTSETNAIRSSCYLTDTIKYSCELDDVERYKQVLCTGECVPVGSVEFVRRAFEQAGIVEPQNLSYHQSVCEYLGRTVRLVPAKFVREQLTEPMFIKPFETKRFTGFVYEPDKSKVECSPDAQESLSGFDLLNDDVLVWVSNVVEFLSEYRYYFRAVDKQPSLLGASRYDPNDCETAVPDISIVFEAANKFYNDTGVACFTLDFGITSKGETLLVEANDAWAIGLYKDSMSVVQYAEFLRTRWNQLFELGMYKGKDK